MIFVSFFLSIIAEPKNIEKKHEMQIKVHETFLEKFIFGTSFIPKYIFVSLCIW